MIGRAAKIITIVTCLFLSNAKLAASRPLERSVDSVNRRIAVNYMAGFSLNAAVETFKLEQKQSLPSLWWTTEQFDPFGGRLVESWNSQINTKEINLIVNLQLWTLMDYLGRYSFVNQFGTIARKYGYNLSIFSTKKQRLATYKYNSRVNPPKWEITLEKLGRDSLKPTSSNYR